MKQVILIEMAKVLKVTVLPTFEGVQLTLADSLNLVAGGAS